MLVVDKNSGLVTLLYQTTLDSGRPWPKYYRATRVLQEI